MKVKTRKSATSAKTVEVKTPFIIAIGASAGGLEALQDFLKHFPSGLDQFAIIVAQHLSPTYRSMLVQLLTRETTYTVTEAVNNHEIEPGKVYITPPDKDIAIVNCRIHLSKPKHASAPKPSVDHLFISLTSHNSAYICGIILSGTGTDGAEGIKALKEKGGLTIIQEPHTAKYNGMPLAAIETGAADLVLSPDKMGEELKEWMDNPDSIRIPQPLSVNEGASALTQIFRNLSDVTGTDFSNYKPSTFCRRLEKRMVRLKQRSIDDYLVYLKDNPQEARELFNNILIGVTTFFRDKEAFLHLEQVLHKIIAAKTPGQSIRIWVPGCASGEEAYSIALLIMQLLQGRVTEYNIQIFGTDIDERAIAHARKGRYAEEALSDIPDSVRDGFFTRVEEGYEISKVLRSMVLFSRHDLTSNPPFLKLDLISCRNLLIYFGNSLQKQIIPLFHYSLVPNGYLFLGKSETVGQYADLFQTIDGKSKIFQRKIGSALHAIKFSSFKPNKLNGLPGKPSRQEQAQEPTLMDIVKETIFLSYDHPYVVVNDIFELQEVSGDVHHFVQLSQGSINFSVLKMTRPDLQLELRTLLTKAQKEMSPQKGNIRKIDVGGSLRYVRVVIKPVISIEKHRPFIITFEQYESDDLVAFQQVPAEDKDIVIPQLKELEQELSATKEHLQTYIEELETTNEELQSLNEEMQSTNEELQSANEELETTNEELQATNEEIQVAYAELKTANAELEKKETELQYSRNNMSALLHNTLQGFILIDTSYNIVAFNQTAQDICKKCKLKHLKAGTTVLDCFLGTDIEAVLNNLKNALAGEVVDFELDMLPDMENQYIFRFNFTPVKNDKDRISGISIGLLDISEERKAKKELINAKFFVDTVFNAAGFGICVTDEKGRFVDVNDQYCNIYGYSRRELKGKPFTLVVPKDNQSFAQEQHDRFIAGEEEIPGEWTVVRKDGKELTITAFASLMIQDNGKRFKVTSIVDITEFKKVQEELQATHQMAKIGSWSYNTQNELLYFDQQSALILPAIKEGKISRKKFYEIMRNQIAVRTATRAFDKLLNNQEEFDIELQFGESLDKDLWIRLSGRTEMNRHGEWDYRGFIQDISNSKAALSDFKIFTKMFEQTPSSILVTDVNGLIEYVNPSFCRLSGYSVEEAIGHTPGFLRWPANNQNIYAAIWKSILNGNVWSGTLKNKKKDGEPFWVSASIAPLKNEKGETINYISIQENITDRILLEQEIKLERVNNQKRITDSIIIAQEKERIEIGQELHDNINQMLASAKIFLSAIHKEDPIFLKVENILAEAINEIRRMSHTLVLPSDLNSSLKDLIGTIISEFNETGKLHFHMSIEDFNEYEIPQNMKLNLYRIFQIQLTNIFRHADAKNVWISLDRKAKHIRLEIKDDGVGFDPGIKTNGIGLMNLRTRAALFDGKVLLDSAPGKGCRIMVEMEL